MPGIDDLSSEDRQALLAERRQELKNWWPGQYGARARWTIEVFPLLHVDEPSGVLIQATNDMRLRRVVEKFAKYFRRELGYDAAPFTAKQTQYDEDHAIEGVLINSRKMSATFPIASGAAGMSTDDDGDRWLDWIWIHPFERGTGLAEQAWRDLESSYGDRFNVEGPVSPAMKSLLSRLNVDQERWDPQRD